MQLTRIRDRAHAALNPHQPPAPLPLPIPSRSRPRAYLDLGIRVAQGPAIVGADVGHAALANLKPADLAQLVGSLLLGDAVHDEAALGVVDQAEVLVGLVQVDHVHDAGGVGHVGLDLAVDLDQALLQDLLHLLAGQGVPGEYSKMDVEVVSPM